MTAPEDDDGAAPVDVVAIDGPSGAGKSTVARRLAARLGAAYLDTGAMYRAVTWFFLEHEHNDLSSRERTRELLDELELELGPDGRVLVQGRDVTAHLRSREVESRVSAVSALPSVRERMRGMQRELARKGRLVAEGRDMTTVVFPGARHRFFLDADPDERAQRRFLEVQGRGRREVTREEVLEELAVRDRLDSTRTDAPLRRSRDVQYVDTTGMGVDEVVELLARRVLQSQPEAGAP